MKKSIALSLCAIIVLLAGITAALAQDAAMVVDVSGGKAVYETGSSQGKDVQLMDFVSRDDKIKLAAGASIVLNYFASGYREKIDGPGVVTVGLDKSSIKGKGEIHSAKVDYIPPQATAQTSDTEHLGVVAMRDVMPSSPQVMPLTLNQTAVRSLPLEFRWAPVPKADRYVLKITDASGREVFRAETEKPLYIMEKSDICRSQEYDWNVKAYDGKATLAEGGGRFYLLNEKLDQQVKYTEDYIRKNYPESTPEYSIAMALLYKKYELNDSARPILLSLQKDYPKNTSIIREIKDLKGNYHPQ